MALGGGLLMLGALLAFPFVLIAQRPGYAAAILLTSVSAMIVINIGFIELGFDAISNSWRGADVARLYNLVASLISTFVAGAAMGLALEQLSWRAQNPSLRDGVALLALSIWYGIVVLLPFAAIGILAVGGISALAPESYRPIVAIWAAIFVGVPFLYVSVRLWFAGPKTLIGERVSLFRTWPLTRGKFWPILGLNAAAFLVALLFGIIPDLVWLPAPETLVSWEEALTPSNLTRLCVTELAFAFATFYFGAAHSFVFGKLSETSATPGA